MILCLFIKLSLFIDKQNKIMPLKVYKKEFPLPCFYDKYPLTFF